MTLLDDRAAQTSLVRPAAEFQTTFLEAAEEYRNAGEELDPAFPGYWSAPFSMYVAQLEAVNQGRHVPLSTVPAATYWLMRADGRFLGASRLRYRLTEALRIEGGHVGYSIRPSERRKGYGALLCALTIEEARNTGRFSRLLVTCDTTNTASARIIEKNGGILENKVISQRTGRQVSRYWVAL